MNYRITSEDITSLNPNEVFVFGSNTGGFHGAGAAYTALKWGAEIGVGIGLKGQTYAIPTKDVTKEGLVTMSIKDIKPYVDDFILFAFKHPNYQFLVTKLGTGLAGIPIESIAPLFKKSIGLRNVSLPKEFWQILI